MSLKCQLTLKPTGQENRAWLTNFLQTTDPNYEWNEVDGEIRLCFTLPLGKRVSFDVKIVVLKAIAEKSGYQFVRAVAENV